MPLNPNGSENYRAPLPARPEVSKGSARAALYRAKANGRNRVERDPGPLAPLPMH